MDSNAEVQSDVPVWRYQSESGTRIVADLGPSVDDAFVEVLDDVAIVVVDQQTGQSQFEISLPESGVADTFITNGVLTIEVIDQ